MPPGPGSRSTPRQSVAMVSISPGRGPDPARHAEEVPRHVVAEEERVAEGRDGADLGEVRPDDDRGAVGGSFVLVSGRLGGTRRSLASVQLAGRPRRRRIQASGSRPRSRASRSCGRPAPRRSPRAIPSRHRRRSGCHPEPARTETGCESPWRRPSCTLGGGRARRAEGVPAQPASLPVDVQELPGVALARRRSATTALVALGVAEPSPVLTHSVPSAAARTAADRVGSVVRRHAVDVVRRRRAGTA